MNLDEIKRKIEEKRRELMKALEGNIEELSSERILQLSEQLDILISEYYRQVKKRD